jgi:hypothetical protein
MENQKIALTKEKKSRKNTYQSLDKWIMKMQIAFGNATLPNIYPVLLTVGYDEVKIAGLNQKLSELENLCQEQTKARADKMAATDNHLKNCKEINLLYSKHRALLKILIGDDKLASTTLKLNVRKKKDFSNWFQDVHNFYGQLTLNTTLASKAACVGITLASIETQLQKLNNLQTLKENGKAQLATDLRNKAFDELRPLYAEYIKYARILLAGNQVLEAIGIKVKSR